MVKFFFTFFVFLGFSSASHAFNTCLDIIQDSPTVWWDEARFLAPNEGHPEHAKPILDRAPEGMIVSVGSERVLFGFLLKESWTTYVVAADVDPIIIRFHQINRILLSLAPDGDIDTYQRLRLKPKWDDWKTAARIARSRHWISDEDFNVITSKKNLDWWIKNVSNNQAFAEMHSRNGFSPVNYIYNRELLEKVQKLAREGRYLVYRVDLSKIDSVVAFIEFLQEIKKTEVGQGFGISILDMSNAWEGLAPNHYLGMDRVASLLFRLRSEFEEGGMTMQTVAFAEERLANRKHFQWAYTGYIMPAFETTFKFWDRQAAFMDSYNYQRQIKMTKVYVLGLADEELPWSEITDLLYF